MTHENFKDYQSGQSICVQVSPQFEQKATGSGMKDKVETIILPHISDPEKLAKMFTEIEAVLAANGFCIELFGTPQNMLNRLIKRLK